MKKTLGTMVAVMVVAVLIGTFIAAKYATAGEKARDGRFIAYDNGTVLDTKTNLMWAAKDNGSDINWSDAKSYCENYRGGGYTNWRMPTHDELAGVYDAAKTSKAACGSDIHLTELIHLTCYTTWESETNFDKAAMFGFGKGRQTWANRSGAYLSRALPVRSVK
jgi:hypothetical protein